MTSQLNYQAQINVTSLVDVSLVILIIFILIAPIMEQGINLNLPSSESGQVKTKNGLTVEVDASGLIYLDGTRVSKTEFRDRLESVKEIQKDNPILIRADQSNSYKMIIEVLDIIRQSGLQKIGLITKQKNS